MLKARWAMVGLIGATLLLPHVSHADARGGSRIRGTATRTALGIGAPEGNLLRRLPHSASTPGVGRVRRAMTRVGGTLVVAGAATAVAAVLSTGAAPHGTPTGADLATARTSVSASTDSHGVMHDTTRTQMGRITIETTGTTQGGLTRSHVVEHGPGVSRSGTVTFRTAANGELQRVSGPADLPLVGATTTSPQPGVTFANARIEQTGGGVHSVVTTHSTRSPDGVTHQFSSATVTDSNGLLVHQSNGVANTDFRSTGDRTPIMQHGSSNRMTTMPTGRGLVFGAGIAGGVGGLGIASTGISAGRRARREQREAARGTVATSGR